jgi:FKBP-type peptidyl-prolyl cis-trans isomerase FkpA
MKKYFLLLIVFVVALASCGKKDSDNFDAAKQAQLDDATITAYIAANNADDSKPKINAVKHSSGLYYEVLTQGTGNNPTANSTISINYSGSVLNGSSFATNENLTNYPLSGLIQGWKIGVPFVKAGGRIKLYIPSGLAYGPGGKGSIPGNAVLIFTIDLLNFN